MTAETEAVSEVTESALHGEEDPFAGDEIERAAAALPWWRRPRKLRRQLAGTLVGVALLSVLLVGGLNFVAARQLLDEGTKDQLVSVGESRAFSIEAGILRTLGGVSGVAADLGTVAALSDFNEVFTVQDTGSLDETEQAEFQGFYDGPVQEFLDEAQVGVDSTDLRPRSQISQYLQYHYLVAQDFDNRSAVIDAGDGSMYSEVHAERHPQMLALAESMRVSEIMLVSGDGDIVYSTQKRVDFATNLETGPYRDTNLADALRNRLQRVRIGESVIADLEIYLPGGGRPVMFVVAGVREDTEVIGALVVQLPVEALSAITTANQGWEDVGLASGESYVVGTDLILRSESRPWIEDPARYLDQVDDELGGFIEFFGSPVGIQPVDTTPVRDSLDGDTFEGTSRNYLGKRNFTYSTPIDSPGVNWVVVSDIPLDDARAPLFEYARRLGLVLVIILPIVAGIGLLMARRLTGPIEPVVHAALAVAAGERNPDLPVSGKDEFGDLARRLTQMAKDLEAEEVALAEEFEERRQLLLTVLPPRIVEEGGVVQGSGETAQLVTVIAVSIDLATDAVTADELAVAEVLGRALEVAEALSDDFGIERVRAGADRYLFLAGVDEPDDAGEEALRYSAKLIELIAALGEAEGIELSVHVGLSSGPVATGMLEMGNLTFAAWGEPVRRALAIGTFATSDEILVDSSTAASAADSPLGSALVAAHDVIDLDGQAMDLYSLPDSAGQASSKP